MRPADEVWNRACGEAGRAKVLTAPGDRALADMLLAHSVAMNGGVLHAVEVLSAEELHAAVAGYRFFGLDAAANVLQEISARWGDGHMDLEAAEQLEFEADERYAAVVTSDEVLVEAFEERYRSEPTAFASVG